MLRMSVDEMALAFSIRIRIESSATGRFSPRHSMDFGFQYPHSDRIICNIESNIVSELGRNFQYPHSDRIICNSGVLRAHGVGQFLSVSAFGSNHLQR